MVYIPKKQILMRFRRYKALNESRLNRALAVMSHDARICLSIVPVLLHYNHINLPGYRKGKTPHGIDLFKPDNAQQKYLKEILLEGAPPLEEPQEKAILGLYAMGSTSSLGQSDSSDLDIWVCVKANLSPEDTKCLQEKCRFVSSYMKAQGVELNLFVTPEDRFTNFQPDSLDEENCGSAQNLFLLDEFYRSSIRLCGRYIIWYIIDTTEEREDYQAYLDFLLTGKSGYPRATLKEHGLLPFDDNSLGPNDDNEPYKEDVNQAFIDASVCPDEQVNKLNGAKSHINLNVRSDMTPNHVISDRVSSASSPSNKDTKGLYSASYQYPFIDNSDLSNKCSAVHNCMTVIKQHRINRLTKINVKNIKDVSTESALNKVNSTDNTPSTSTINAMGEELSSSAYATRDNALNSTVAPASQDDKSAASKVVYGSKVLSPDAYIANDQMVSHPDENAHHIAPNQPALLISRVKSASTYSLDENAQILHLVYTGYSSHMNDESLADTATSHQNSSDVYSDASSKSLSSSDASASAVSASAAAASAAAASASAASIAHNLNENSEAKSLEHTSFTFSSNPAHDSDYEPISSYVSDDFHVNKNEITKISAKPYNLLKVDDKFVDRSTFYCMRNSFTSSIKSVVIPEIKLSSAYAEDSSDNVVVVLNELNFNLRPLFDKTFFPLHRERLGIHTDIHDSSVVASSFDSSSLSHLDRADVVGAYYGVGSLKDIKDPALNRASSSLVLKHKSLDHKIYRELLEASESYIGVVYGLGSMIYDVYDSVDDELVSKLKNLVLSNVHTAGETYSYRKLSHNDCFTIYSYLQTHEAIRFSQANYGNDCAITLPTIGSSCVMCVCENACLRHRMPNFRMQGGFAMRAMLFNAYVGLISNEDELTLSVHNKCASSKIEPKCYDDPSTQDREFAHSALEVMVNSNTPSEYVEITSVIASVMRQYDLSSSDILSLFEQSGNGSYNTSEEYNDDANRNLHHEKSSDESFDGSLHDKSKHSAPSNSSSLAHQKETSGLSHDVASHEAVSSKSVNDQDYSLNDKDKRSLDLSDSSSSEDTHEREVSPLEALGVLAKKIEQQTQDYRRGTKAVFKKEQYDSLKEHEDILDAIAKDKSGKFTRSNMIRVGQNVRDLLLNAFPRFFSNDDKDHSALWSQDVNERLDSTHSKNMLQLNASEQAAYLASYKEHDIHDPLYVAKDSDEVLEPLEDSAFDKNAAIADRKSNRASALLNTKRGGKAFSKINSLGTHKRMLSLSSKSAKRPRISRNYTHSRLADLSLHNMARNITKGVSKGRELFKIKGMVKELGFNRIVSNEAPERNDNDKAQPEGLQRLVAAMGVTPTPFIDGKLNTAAFDYMYLDAMHSGVQDASQHSLYSEHDDFDQSIGLEEHVLHDAYYASKLQSNANSLSWNSPLGLTNANTYDTAYEKRLNKRKQAAEASLSSDLDSQMADVHDFLNHDEQHELLGDKDNIQDSHFSDDELTAAALSHRLSEAYYDESLLQPSAKDTINISFDSDLDKNAIKANALGSSSSYMYSARASDSTSLSTRSHAHQIKDNDAGQEQISGLQDMSNQSKTALFGGNPTMGSMSFLAMFTDKRIQNEQNVILENERRIEESRREFVGDEGELNSIDLIQYFDGMQLKGENTNTRIRNKATATNDNVKVVNSSANVIVAHKNRLHPNDEIGTVVNSEVLRQRDEDNLSAAVEDGWYEGLAPLKEEEWFDFGSVVKNSPREYFGSGLWLLYKAIDSPFKVVLKILLMEAYSYDYPDTNLLSSELKDYMLSHDGYSLDLDSYYLMYLKVSNYLQLMGHEARLTLMRKCFYLKIYMGLSSKRSYNKEDYRVKRELLDKFAKRWGWSEKFVSDLESVALWRMSSVRAFNHEVYNTLLESYQALLRFSVRHGIEYAITSDDMGILSRKLYAAFDRYPGKILVTHTSFSHNLAEANLCFIHPTEGSLCRKGWHLYTASSEDVALLNTKVSFIGSRLAETVAWACFNGLLTSHTKPWVVGGSPAITPLKIKLLTGDIMRNLVPKKGKVSESSLQRIRELKSCIVVLNLERDETESFKRHAMDTTQGSTLCCGRTRTCLVGSVDLVLLNSWGELRCVPMPDGEDGVVELLASLLRIISNSSLENGNDVNELLDRIEVCSYADAYQDLIKYDLEGTIRQVFSCMTAGNSSEYEFNVGRNTYIARNWDERGVVINRKSSFGSSENDVSVLSRYGMRPEFSLQVPPVVDRYATSGIMQYFFVPLVENGHWDIYIINERNEVSIYNDYFGSRAHLVNAINRFYTNQGQNKSQHKLRFNLPQYFVLSNDMKSIHPFTIRG